jgi:hypothetical protein
VWLRTCTRRQICGNNEDIRNTIRNDENPFFSTFGWGDRGGYVCHNRLARFPLHFRLDVDVHGAIAEDSAYLRAQTSQRHSKMQKEDR